MLLNIKADAIFIADAHFNKQRTTLESLIDDILSENIKTSQLFLMGDMFDFLCDEVDYFKKINETLISKINILSNNIELIYLEGNHDFNLQYIFPNINVIKRDFQPLIAIYENTTISIAHGDIFTTTLYNIFTAIIRNKYILKILNFLDISNIISIYVENMLIKKDICHNFSKFESFAQARIDVYKKYDAVDIIVEGHFHQGKSYEKYINIPSLACGSYYSQVKIKEDLFTLEHLQYS